MVAGEVSDAALDARGDDEAGLRPWAGRVLRVTRSGGVDSVAAARARDQRCLCTKRPHSAATALALSPNLRSATAIDGVMPFDGKRSRDSPSRRDCNATPGVVVSRAAGYCIVPVDQLPAARLRRHAPDYCFSFTPGCWFARNAIARPPAPPRSLFSLARGRVGRAQTRRSTCPAPGRSAFRLTIASATDRARPSPTAGLA